MFFVNLGWFLGSLSGVQIQIGEQKMDSIETDRANMRKRKDNECFHKAVERGQQTFTLVAQDYSAPKTILFWIMENISTISEEKARDAFEDALAMRRHPRRKNPD